MPKRRGYDSRIQWLMLALVTAALLLTGVLVQHAYRADRARQQAIALAMRDYADFAGWQLGRRIADEVVTTDVIAFSRAAPRIRNPSAPDALGVPAFADAVREQSTLCRCLDSVVAFVRVDIATGHVETEPASAVADERVRWAADSMLAFATSEPPVPSMRVFGRIRTGSAARQGPVLITGNVVHGALGTSAAGGDVSLPFILVRDRSGTPIVAYGYIVPTRVLIGGHVERILAAERLLPERLASSAPTDSVLRIRVSSASGTTLHANESAVPSTYTSTTTLDRAFGRLRLDVALDPGVASRLDLPGAPRQLRLRVLLLLFVMIAGLVAATALQLHRQQNFVRLRAHFVAGVSHELRTPLAQIRLLAELLRMEKPMSDENRGRSLAIIDQEARRLSYLVENVLAYSRSERSPAPLSIAPLPIDLEIEGAVEAFLPLARSHGTNITVDAPADLVVPLDRGSFRQVMVNLLDNAVRYGPDGQTVRVVVRAADGDAQVSVEDDGPGIPASDRERVWEPYYRLPRDEGGAHGGSGLGLAVVADVVARHGGRAWVESPDRGARIVVALPLSPRKRAIR